MRAAYFTCTVLPVFAASQIGNEGLGTRDGLIVVFGEGGRKSRPAIPMHCFVSFVVNPAPDPRLSCAPSLR